MGFCDFNTPYSRGKEACMSLCKGMSALNEVNPSKSCTLMILPDNARESSLRGLFDEERQIFEELFSLAQACDARWIDLYARETRSADSRSNSRKFGSGRIVTSSTMLDANEWLKSELAVYGRVVGVNESTEGAPLAVLPRTASILIPESSSPDALRSQGVAEFEIFFLFLIGQDSPLFALSFYLVFSKDSVRVSERLRPSIEQLSAQKGSQRLQMLVESCLRYCKFPAVCIVNLTGYVEELAGAVTRLQRF